jgi:hypothetical protein
VTIHQLKERSFESDEGADKKKKKKCEMMAWCEL